MGQSQRFRARWRMKILFGAYNIIVLTQTPTAVRLRFSQMPYALNQDLFGSDKRLDPNGCLSLCISSSFCGREVRSSSSMENGQRRKFHETIDRFA